MVDAVERARSARRLNLVKEEDRVVHVLDGNKVLTASPCAPPEPVAVPTGAPRTDVVGSRESGEPDETVVVVVETAPTRTGELKIVVTRTSPTSRSHSGPCLRCYGWLSRPRPQGSA